jgi:histidinol-phosphatase (PHP family)
MVIIVKVLPLSPIAWPRNEAAMYFDCHVHSKFSPDGCSRIGEYCIWVDEGRLKSIGFAEHLDFLPECGAYGFLNYKRYMDEIKKYKELGYSFYAGAEIDYDKCVEDDILKRLYKERYDYTICSIHMVKGVSVSDREIGHFYNRKVFDTMIQGYYEQLKFALKVEKFDAIGHIGVYKRYLQDDFYDTKLKSRINELDLEVARLCSASNKIVEVNTSGLFAASRSTIPDIFFLKEYYNNGGRKVCMSSDAHNAKDAGRGFEIVKDMLLDIGFDQIYLPWDKENGIQLR